MRLRQNDSHDTDNNRNDRNMIELRYQKRDRREWKEKKKEEEILASRDNKEEISSRLAVRKAFGFNNVCLYMVENVFVNAEGCFFLSKQ